MLIQQQSRIWLINGTLAMIALFFSFKAFTIPTAADIPGQRVAPETQRMAPFYIKPIKRALPQPSQFNDIVKMNLFSKDRAEILPMRTTGSAGTTPPPKVITGLVLYGIVIEGDQKSALVANLEEKQNKELIWIQNGDRVGRFIIKDILADRILVLSSNILYTLRMSDGSKQNKAAGSLRNQKSKKRPVKKNKGAQLKKPTEGRKASTRYAPAR